MTNSTGRSWHSTATMTVGSGTLMTWVGTRSAVRSNQCQGAIEDRSRVPQVVFQVEPLVDPGGRKAGAGLRVGAQQRAEAPLARHGPERALLHELVGGLPRHALAHEREHDGLAEVEAARE